MYDELPIATPLVVPGLAVPYANPCEALSTGGIGATATTLDTPPLVSIANPARILATIIFFLPVVFLAISDTTT